eukprot:5899172-Lingulodinium_polyedra.AAC.1
MAVPLAKRGGQTLETIPRDDVAANEKFKLVKRIGKKAASKKTCYKPCGYIMHEKSYLCGVSGI